MQENLKNSPKTCTEFYTGYGFSAAQTAKICANPHFNFTDTLLTCFALSNMWANNDTYQPYWVENFLSALDNDTATVNSLIFDFTKPFSVGFYQAIQVPIFTHYSATPVCPSNGIQTICSTRQLAFA